MVEMQLATVEMVWCNFTTNGLLS